LKLPCQAYTGLFDIGRSNIDGRNLDHYRAWLKLTIESIPNLVVYHDGSCDDLIGLDCNFQRIPKESLKAFSYESDMKKILKEFIPSSPSDITFRLPQYSLVQFAKFELGNKVVEDFHAESILWVDAGISRFIEKTITQDMLNRSAHRMLMHSIDAAFEIDLRNNFNLKSWSISKSEIGSCRRVISGTSFWMHSRILQEFNQKIHKELENWLEFKVWDNEQVLLRSILPLEFRIHFIPQVFASTGGVAKAFGRNGGKVLPFLNSIINLGLERGN